MKELIWKWNAILEGLIQVKKDWNELRLSLQEEGVRGFQQLPVIMQKGLPNIHSTFDVGIIRLIEKQRGYGELEDLIVNLEEEKEEEKEDGNSGKARRGSAGRRTGGKD